MATAEAEPTVPSVQARSDGLFATVQIAQLPNGRLAIEIGTSDRDTLDTELLPMNINWFVVSLEPLSDKYARGLARNTVGKGDQFQGLGQHHERGLILPLAVGEVPTDGGSTLTFHVGQNAGCSSLLSINKASDRLKWCKKVEETRLVPTVSLEAVLGWAAMPVDFIKVDAQGLDAAVITSARSRLGQVRRFALEVISDDCHTLYEGQPRCSAVVAQATQLGFEPASPVHCAPSPELRHGWRRTAWGCELEIVFVARGVPMLPELWRFHQLSHGGCSATSYATIEAVPHKAVVMVGPGQWKRKGRVGQITDVTKQIKNTAGRFVDGLYACTRFTP